MIQMRFIFLLLAFQNSGLELQVGDLESQLVHEREDLRVRFAHMNEELAELRLTLEEQTQEYSDLLDIKIRLDREIEAYRKLLESEECRCVVRCAVPARLELCQPPPKGTLADVLLSS